MSIPAFTAQASLYRTSNHYRSVMPGRALPRGTVLVPQRGGPGFEGRANCYVDCVDQHPQWAGARCNALCRDPGGIGSSGGYGPSCAADPPDECGGLGLAACIAALGPFGCALVWSDLRETCLENSARECLIARQGPLTGGSSYPRSATTRLYEPGKYLSLA